MQISKEEAIAEIQRLIDKYTRISTKGELKKYNEAMTKNDFIEPLFEALGWDVRNTETDDEVTPEDKVSKGRVDYAFRIEGIPKFLLEAKAIKVDLDEPKWAEQAINYSWHKGVIWAILCDFEGVKVFNSEVKELNPLQSMFFSINYDEYIDRFGQLWLLSRESFEKGIIDREAEKWGKKLKKVPVDKQLLADFTRFRDILSKDILLMNKSKHLDRDEIDEAVQRILNRLIFIRKCEDNNLESNKLQSTYRVWDDTREGRLYNRVKGIFRYFERQYDSELFEHCICDQIDISNQVAKEVILGLYSTKDKLIHYDFSAIDADVLGNIYEQYLGHIFKKTAKRAKVEARHARRKEMGIYYTPTYIVDYIVKNTVGELLKDKKFNADNIKILDPACGSGSFLIKAFDYLNAFHGRRDKGLTQAYLDLSGASAIYSKKVKILKDNIFGVDLDPKSVEIAQLNLLLKTLEKRHRLPMLQENIKCGNSLIDDEEVAGDRAFKWEEEFEEIMNDGGFDVVIGNPPYVQLSMEKIDPEYKEHLIKTYGSSMGRLNTFGFFIKLGISLLKEGGRLGFIIPNTILTQDYYEELREMILDSCKIESIVNFSDLPFKDAVVENIIIILQKEKSEKKRNSNLATVLGLDERLTFLKQREIRQGHFKNTHKKGFNIYLNDRLIKLQFKIEEKTRPLGEHFEVNQAIALKHDRAKYLDKIKKDDSYKKVIDGRHINRYNLQWDGTYLHYDINAIHSCKREDIFLSEEKIFFRRVGDSLMGALDKKQFYALNTLVAMNKKEGIELDIQYFLALFNSTLLNFYYQTFLKSTKKVFSEIQARQVKQLPIRAIDFENTSEKNIHDSLVDLVDKMLSLNKRLNQLKDKETTEKKGIEKEIEKTDAKIDEMVYDLYRITEKERGIIEESL